MQGTIIEKSDDLQAFVLIVENLSEEIKVAIRDDLAKICHGAQKSDSGSTIYSYEFTVREFVKRYKKKSRLIQMGMIGELLTHVFLTRVRSGFKTVSPFFNAEESSIKKGFDIILFEKTQGAIWFTEVKSGELGGLTADAKVKSLIDIAKRDIAARIGENDSTTWYSAINNIELALASGKPEKSILITLLSKFLIDDKSGDDVVRKNSTVLVPVVFESTDNVVDSKQVFEKQGAISKENRFKDCIVFAIQKSTFAKVEDFLYDEAKN